MTNILLLLAAQFLKSNVSAIDQRKQSLITFLVDPIPPFDEYFMLPESMIPEENFTSELQSDPITEEKEKDLVFRSTELDSPILPPTHPNSFFSIIETLLPLYRRALSNPNYQADMHFCIDGKGTEKHARRVAYGIKLLYGIEFSWKVIMNFEPTAEKMAERIQEARVILAPSLDDIVTLPESDRGRSSRRLSVKESISSAATSRSQSPAEFKTRRVLSNLKLIRAERELRKNVTRRRRHSKLKSSGESSDHSFSENISPPKSPKLV